MSVLDEDVYEPATEPVTWTLPTRAAEFLDWLDDARLSIDTYDAVIAFMDLPVAKKMPATLKDELRSLGYEV